MISVNFNNDYIMYLT